MLKKALVLALLFTYHFSEARVVLPAVFSDNMVLQQKTNAAIWGKANPGAKVNISTTWSSKKYNGIADGEGNWKIRVSTPAYGGPYTITISDGEATTLNNILIGDVWVCSGQSNMEMPLAGWGKIKDFQKEINNASYPGIRLLQVKQTPANRPENDVEIINKGWSACTPATIAEFSSTAYFFAREINRKTKVPIGLIHTSWGGTIAEAWVSGDALKKMPDFKEAVTIVEQAEEQRDHIAALMKAWNKMVVEKDLGMKGELPVWNAENFNDSSWPEMKIPAFWETTLKDLDGIVWFRHKINIPQGWAGKPLKISLGPVDDNEITWFNGQKIGETTGYSQPRNYNIPANLVKAGENTITVRVFDTGGGGGIYGEEKDLYLENEEGEKIPLGGTWKYHLGLDFKQVDPIPDQQNGPNRPSVLYNGMIHPFLPLSIKGAIWYQGESNAERADQYRALFPSLIKDWREKWKQGDFPFYFVQLASFMKKEEQPGPSDWAELRDAQFKTLSLPNTGMASAIDIGDTNDIHPKNKQEVGRRLALIALAKNYNQKIVYSGPVALSHKTEGNRIEITFDFAASGLKASNGEVIKGFSIAGADQKFYWADAVIKGNKVTVSSAEVPDPVAVRYSWANNPDGNLVNETGLPASPFRTDDWKGITFGKK